MRAPYRRSPRGRSDFEGVWTAAFIPSIRGGDVPMNCSAKPVASRTPTSRPSARCRSTWYHFDAEALRQA